jgi:hypothetical protein
MENDVATDITVNDAEFSTSGFIVYEDFETGVDYSGSAILQASSRDGFSVFGSDVVWDTLKPTEARFTSQTNIGLNEVDISSETIDTRGDNNVVQNNVQIARVEGSDNLVQNNSKFVTILGTENTIESNVNNSAILQSNTSSITEDTTLSTIIGGDNTIISGSNKSVVIGQDLTIQGGNSNIVIGNNDTTTKVVKDLINTVVINPNRDLESWENLGGDDFSGRAYLGSYNQIGALYRETKQITVGPGDTLYLTGSDYANDYFHLMSWSGGNGTAIVYLPESDPNNLGTNRDSNGYKRELRFFTDNTVNANDKIQITAIGTDTLDGGVGNNYELKKPFDGITLFAPISGSWFNIQTKA